MLTVNRFAAPLDTELEQKISQISPATLGHLTSEGFPRGMSPLSRPIRMAGTAVTLRLPTLDSSLMHYVADRVGKGHVLVIDRCGEDFHACLGGMVGYRLMLAGISGVVVDGPVTDTDELLDYGFPVFHRGISSTTTRIFAPAGLLNVPVTVGGCTIAPGDVVIGDSDGIFTSSLEWLLPQADELIKKQQWEAPAKEQLREGAEIAALSGAIRLIEATMEGTS